jgi:hypothetical protein
VSADAIAAWHDLLDDELAAEAAAWLAARQRDRDILFGGRPLCTVLRPRFLSPADYDALRLACTPLLAAMHRAGAMAIADREFRAGFRLADWEESLLDRFPRYPSLFPLSRIDAFIDPATGDARLTEMNAETPAGVGYSDVLAELFLALPVMARFARDWVVRTMPTRPHLLAALLDTWRAVRGTRQPPRIAIVDWDDVPTLGEFRITAEYLRAMGLGCLITTPAALEYRDGVLRGSDGERIDLVYKRVLLHELVHREGLDHPLLRAAIDGAVVMVNPPHGKPLHKKAALAVLTDERHAGRFAASEREAIRRHVPWTRVVEERRTEIDGAAIDLLPWISAHRETLVLKPNDDYGGSGIVLGWTVDDTAWQAALREALERPTVVQHRIALPREPFPALAEGRLEIADRIVDTAPFCWQGAFMDGMLTRISTDTLVNVTAGGGSTVPTLVVEPRQ